MSIHLNQMVVVEYAEEGIVGSIQAIDMPR